MRQFNSNIIKTAAQLQDPKNISKHRIEGKEMLPEEKLKWMSLALVKGAQFAKKWVLIWSRLILTFPTRPNCKI